jgi:hypothetical protein
MLLLLGALLSSACAVFPPVQEMSDARQAIRAAIDADARRHAPQNLQQAEEFLDQASRSLERRAYDEARREALAAKEQAVQARDRSLAQATPSTP